MIKPFIGPYEEANTKIELPRFEHGVSFRVGNLIRTTQNGTTMKYVGLKPIRVYITRESGENEERDMYTDDTIECQSGDSIRALVY